jgi:MFS family permease
MTTGERAADRVDHTLGQGSLGYLVLICFVATLGGLLFGYDTAVISGAIEYMEARFLLSSAAKGWAASSALVGCVLGCLAAGWLNDHLGRKKVLVVCAVLFLISAIGSAVPEQLALLLSPAGGRAGGASTGVILAVFSLFRLLGGIGVGAASMTSPMYIAEVSPAPIRGRMVSLNQLAIVTGMLVVYFVNVHIGRYGDQVDAALLARHNVAVDQIDVQLAALGQLPWNVASGWRWMFASEAIPSLALLLLLLLVPESPRWLTKQGRRDQAEAVLARINGPLRARHEVAAIEKAIAAENGSLRQLFQPGLRNVLIIGVALAVLQQVTGINVFLYFGPGIFTELAGAAMDAALLQQVVIGAVNLVFTIVAIWTVDLVGRKPLMLIGFAGMAVSLLTLGLAAYVGRADAWLLIFICTYIACFALSVGPVTWVILSEIFPTRIRGRALGIATVCLWTANFVISLTFPMLDKNPWLVAKFQHAFPFWMYGAFCVLAVLFVARMVPETKGRTLEQIEQSWL